MTLHTTSFPLNALQAQAFINPSKKCVESVDLEKLLDKELPLQTRGGAAGKVALLAFLASLLEAFSNSEFGSPLRFDLVGGGAAFLATEEGALQDLDFALEFPEEITPKLEKMAALIKKCLHEHGAKGEPFFRKSLIPPSDDFKAVILSFGQEGKFWVDLTVSTVKKRLFLFRRDAVRISLLPYLKEKGRAAIESTCGDLDTVLYDRKNKKIVIPDPQEINHIGWPTLLLLIAKGHTLETDEANDLLQKTFLTFVKNEGKFGVFELLKKTFNNHGISESLKSPYYLLAFLSLIDKITDAELQLIAREGTLGKSNESQFLRLAAAACKNKKWRHQLSPLAIVVGVIKWPKPSAEVWENFTLNLSDLDPMQKDLTKLLSGKTIKELFLQFLFNESIINFECRKSFVRLFLQSSSSEEGKKWLPLCLDFFLSVDSPFAAELGRKYASLLPLEKKIALSRSLNGLSLYQYLDAERKDGQFNALYSKISSSKLDAQFTEYLVQGSPSLEDALSIVTWIRKLNLSLDSEIAALLFEKIIQEKGSPLSSLLFLVVHLENSKREEALLSLSPLLKESLIKALSSEDKKILEGLWQTLWLLLPNDKRNGLIQLLKRAKLSIIVRKEEFLLQKAKYPPDDLSLSTLLQNSSSEDAVRRALAVARIVILENEKRFDESQKLFLRNRELLQEESCKKELFEKSDPLSPMHRQVASFLREPPLRDLDHLAALAKEANEIDLLYRFVEIAQQHNFFSENTLELFFSLKGECARKAKLLSNFPVCITEERVTNIRLHTLEPSLAHSLFSALLEKESAPYISEALQLLSKKTKIEFLWSAIPQIIRKITFLETTIQKEEFHFWFSIFPPLKWLEIEKNEAFFLLETIQNEPRLSKVILCLEIASGRAESLKRALHSLVTSNGSEFLTLSCHFIEKTATVLSFDNELMICLFRQIINELKKIEENKTPYLVKRLKKTLESKDCPQYLRLYFCILPLFPESQKEIAEQQNHLSQLLERLYQKSSSYSELVFLETPLPEKCLNDFSKSRQKEISSWISAGIPSLSCNFTIGALLKSIHDQKKQLEAIDFCFEVLLNTIIKGTKTRESPEVSWKNFLDSLLTVCYSQLLAQNTVFPRVDTKLFAETLKAIESPPILAIQFLDRLISGWLKILPFVSRSLPYHQDELIELFTPLLHSAIGRSHLENNPSLPISIGNLLIIIVPRSPDELQILTTIVSLLSKSPIYFNLTNDAKVADFLTTFIFRPLFPQQPEITQQHLEKIIQVVDALLLRRQSRNNVQTSLAMCWLAKIPMRFTHGFSLIQQLISQKPLDESSKENAAAMDSSLKLVFNYLESVDAEAFSVLAFEILDYLFTRKEIFMELALMNSIKRVGNIALKNSHFYKGDPLPIAFEKILYSGIEERVKAKLSGSETTLTGLIALYGNFLISWYEEDTSSLNNIKTFFIKAVNSGFYFDRNLFYFHINNFLEAFRTKNEKDNLHNLEQIQEIYKAFQNPKDLNENEREQL